ncbi:MAG TPA: SDR family oxidoreductase [Bryobacteraceae bacterium]|nr:SDR family oxidoreductase [Bryobacteraceae bacterium]
MRLKDRIAVITGAATGIGAATAEVFAREGAKVIIGDINETAAEATVGRIHAAGGEAAFLPCDVASPEQVRRLIAAPIERYGRLDILHNNAAYLFAAFPVAETAEEEWEKTIQVNLRSVYVAAKAAIPHMVRQGGGVIINTASVLGVVGAPTYSAYIASKGGIIQLTRSIAIDYGKQGIRCNALCPGITASPPAAESMKNPEHMKYLMSMTVLGRPATPAEIANAALFLASDESSYVTGTCLFADGGWTCM